jgi:hypothetical protein
MEVGAVLSIVILPAMQVERLIPAVYADTILSAARLPIVIRLAMLAEAVVMPAGCVDIIWAVLPTAVRLVMLAEAAVMPVGCADTIIIVKGE